MKGLIGHQAKFTKQISEFKVCNLSEEYIENFYAPFVKESDVKIGLKFKEKIDIKSNNTYLIIGQITNIYVNSLFIEEDGTINLERSNSLSVGGLNTYYKLQMLNKFPYENRKYSYFLNKLSKTFVLYLNISLTCFLINNLFNINPKIPYGGM